MVKIKFDGRLNIIALTSLVLSLIAISHAFYGFVRGPRVEMHAPHALILRKVTFPGDPSKASYLNIEAPLTYTNLGEIGYNDIVANETVFFALASQPKQMEAYWYFDDVDDSTKNAENAPKYAGTTFAGPKVVPARDAITHWTRFTSKPVNCPNNSTQECNVRANYVPFDDALPGLIAASPRIDITFSAELLGSRASRHASCWISGRDLDVAIFKNNSFAAITCYPSEK